MARTGIREWLESQDLGEYAEAFEAEKVGLEALPELEEADLKEMGLPIGPRKLVLKAIRELKSEPTRSVEEQPEGAVQDHSTTRPLEAERRQITVMFCDLVGSTALSEQLDPEDLRSLMQSYQKACGSVIERYEGHVAQYLGDGLVTYFGWPKAHEDDAERAIRAGLDIVNVVKTVDASTPLQVRVGIATGAVVVGETGAGDASIPTAAIGETPNIAARLQTLADPDQVVVAAGTHRLAGGVFDYVSLGAPALKGVVEPMAVWRVLRQSQAADRFEAQSIGGLTPLIGRRSEFAMLTERWEQAKDGEGQVVLLSGEPGIGKSRIAKALRDELASMPHTRLSYQCSPYYTNSAFYPIITQFERAAGFASDDTGDQKLDKMETTLSAGTGAVANAAPVIANMLSLPVERYPPLDLAPQQLKEMTYTALVDQVVGLAASAPVLVIFEDAHWADPTTLEAIAEVITRIEAEEVLLLFSARPEFNPPWPIAGHIAVHSLTRLSRRLGTDMVARVAGGRMLPQEVVDQIIAKTDGVPLFVEELTKTVLETGQLREDGDRYVLDGPLPSLAIPATLQDSLMARLDRLESVKEVAQIGACIGREFSHRLLTAVSPLDDTPLDEALQRLVDSELIFRRGGSQDTVYTFKHALIQDAAYGSLLNSNRQQIHATIAEALLSDFPRIVEVEPELLAHHFSSAALFDAAIPYAIQAGQRTLQRLASQEAIAHFQNGLEYLGTLEELPERAGHELELQNGLALATTMRYGYSAPQTGYAYERAYELARLSADPPEMFHILYGLSINRMTSDRFLEGLASAKDMLDYAEKGDNLSGKVLANRWYGTMQWFLPDLQPAQLHLERALALYDEAEHKTLIYHYGHDPKALGLAYLGNVMAARGFADQGRRLVDEAVSYGGQLDFPYGIAHVNFVAAVFFCAINEPENVGRHTAVQARIAEDYDFPFWESLAWSLAGWAHRKQDPKQARNDRERGLEQVRQLKMGPGLTFNWVLHADALIEEGDIKEAERILENARSLADQLGAKFNYAEIIRLQGVCHLHGDNEDAEAAEALLREAMVVAGEQKARLYELRAATSLARLWQSQGKNVQAHDLLAPVYGWFIEGFDTTDLIEAKALLDELA